MLLSHEGREALGVRMCCREWADVADRGQGAHSPAVILLAVEDLKKGSGWFVRGYDRIGRQTVASWHGGLIGARVWAASEYGHDAIGAWHDIPDDVADPVGYALRARR